MTKKPYILLGSLISLGSVGAILKTTTYNTKLKRKYYNHELYVSTYFNSVMSGDTKIKTGYIQNYLKYLNSLKGTYTDTTSDDQYVYFKIYVPFTGNEVSNIYKLNLKHGNHYHTVYIDDDGIFEKNKRNDKFFEIKVPIWNGKIEYANAFIKNDYIENPNNILDIWKYVDLSVGNPTHEFKIDSSRKVSKFQVDHKFIYKILKSNQIKWKTNEAIKTYDTFINYIKSHSFKDVLNNIEEIDLNSTTSITLQYILALKNNYEDIFSKFYVGSNNPNFDWQYNLYQKGVPIGSAAYKYAYDFVKKASEVNGGIFKKKIKIDSKLFRWWLRNKPFVFEKQFGIDPDIISKANRSDYDSLIFYNSLKNNLNSFEYNIRNSKERMPDISEEDMIEMEVYGTYIEKDGVTKKYYFDSVVSLINHIYIYKNDSLPKITTKRLRNTEYPYLDSSYEGRNLNSDVEYFENTSNDDFIINDKIKFEDIIKPVKDIYYIYNETLITEPNDTVIKKIGGA